VKEGNLMRRLMLALSGKAVVFRNNQGVAHYPDGSVVRYGLANPGGSDLIGWTSRTVTPEMVGKKIAIFTAVEVKIATGRTSDAQRNFLQAVETAGGIAVVARSETDLSTFQ
jgi:hypothetical protein